MKLKRGKVLTGGCTVAPARGRGLKYKRERKVYAWKESPPQGGVD